MSREEENGWCPECGIGLNNREIDMGFCQNCKAHWAPKSLAFEQNNETEPSIKKAKTNKP